MINLTNDQYQGLNKLEKWYRKHNHQVIEVSGVVGTGVFELIQKFLYMQGFDSREVMYLSYDQKQVLELAAKRYHAYYINGIIYKYTRNVDFNSLPVINQNSDRIEYQWKKDVRSKIDERYRIIIVFDSVLLNYDTVNDLCSFGLPIVLLRDPILIPSADTYTFLRRPNISLNELHPDLIRNPITYFANKVLAGEKLRPGNYDSVSIIPRNQMNLYNIRSSNMTITISESLREYVNNVYREKILKQKGTINIPGERVICMSNMYAHRLVNKDEKKIKVYLVKGLVGNITKINRHVATTKYVPIEFRPECYMDIFDDLVLDRHFLNKMEFPCRQIIPDETILMEYAYALTPQLARLSHWDKVTLIADTIDDEDQETQRMLMYTSITRSRRSLTILV